MIGLTQPSVAHRIESFDVVALSKVFDRIENDSIEDPRAFHEKRLPRFPDDRSWFGNGSGGFRVEWAQVR